MQKKLICASAEEAFAIQVAYLKKNGRKIAKICTVLDIEGTEEEIEKVTGGWRSCELHSKHEMKNLVEQGQIKKAKLDKGESNLLRLTFDGLSHSVCIVDATTTAGMYEMQIGMVLKHHTKERSASFAAVSAAI